MLPPQVGDVQDDRFLVAAYLLGDPAVDRAPELRRDLVGGLVEIDRFRSCPLERFPGLGLGVLIHCHVRGPPALLELADLEQDDPLLALEPVQLADQRLAFFHVVLVDQLAGYRLHPPGDRLQVRAPSGEALDHFFILQFVHVIPPVACFRIHKFISGRDSRISASIPAPA